MIFGICGRQENVKALKCTVVASEGITKAVTQISKQPIAAWGHFRAFSRVPNNSIQIELNSTVAVEMEWHEPQPGL